MTVSTRPLVSTDERQWRTLWTAYLAFYETAVPEEVCQTTFRRLTDSNRSEQAGFVAERQGQIIGLAHVVYHPHNWRVEDVCYLQDLYVTPAVRGTGVGHALVDAVYAAADANGTPAVYWLTQDFNKQARRLYDRIACVSSFIRYNRPS